MKKIICVLLSVVTAVVMFSACSANKEAKSENADFSLKFTWDSHYSDVSEGAKTAYENAAQAIVNGDDSVSYSSQISDEVTSLLYTSFPLISLVDSIDTASGGNSVTITYKKDKEKHAELVSAFSNKVQEIMEQCGYGSVSSNEYVVNVYHYVATNVAYDSNVTDTYSAITTGKGMSAAISGMFEYLLLQGGVEACHMVGKDASGTPWFFSRCKLGDTWYNFDIAAECAMNDGNGLTGFAMTDKEIISTGVQKGFSYSDQSEPSAVDIKENKYSVLRTCQSFEIKSDVITAKLYDGETKEISM